MTAPRAYTLDAERAGDSVRVRITRSGPDQPTRVALGRSAADAGRWPGLLFPVCPIAQTAAALGAVEAAGGGTLPPGQAAAREHLVSAEAIAGAVWRAALTWGPKLGLAADPAPVRQARAAVEALGAALFDGDWKTPGGGALRLDRPGIAAATAALRSALDAVASVTAAAIEAASSFKIAAAPGVIPLGEDISDPDIMPAALVIPAEHGPASAGPAQSRDLPRFEADRPQAATVVGPVSAPHRCALQRARDDTGEVVIREETPRARAGLAPRTLGDWFAASDAAARGHADSLAEIADLLADDAPTALPPGATGRGIGIVETARGRLRHVIDLEAGRIAIWRVDAPTDWNFAPGGPVEAWAHALDPGADPDAALDWLLAAFDPCAPARLSFGAGHA